MRAIGNRLLILPIEKPKQQGGIFLSDKDRAEARYVTAIVESPGDEVPGIKKGDKIWYDKANCFEIMEKDKIFTIIKFGDVIMVDTPLPGIWKRVINYLLSLKSKLIGSD